MSDFNKKDKKFDTLRFKSKRIYEDEDDQDTKSFSRRSFVDKLDEEENKPFAQSQEVFEVEMEDVSQDREDELEAGPEHESQVRSDSFNLGKEAEISHPLYYSLGQDDTFMPKLIKYLNFIAIFLIFVLVAGFLLDRNIFLISDIMLCLGFFALLYNQINVGLILTFANLLVNLYGIFSTGYRPFFNRFMNFLALLGSIILFYALIKRKRKSKKIIEKDGRRIIK